MSVTERPTRTKEEESIDPQQTIKSSRKFVEDFQNFLQRVDSDLYKKPKNAVEGAKSHIDFIDQVGALSSEYFTSVESSRVKWGPSMAFTIERFEFSNLPIANSDGSLVDDGTGGYVTELDLWYFPGQHKEKQKVTSELIDTLAAQGKTRLIGSLGNQSKGQILDKFLGEIN